ncbi:MAG: hypothetical protein IK060_06065 [Methanomicrobium sp.]|nr:hypothetical protein [Methanomicrobium sp.]
MNQEGEALTAENFDAALKYLDVLESQSIISENGEEIAKTGGCEAIKDFLMVLYYNNWLINTRWQDWTGIAETHLGHRELLKEADVETIRKILTVHVRIDRLFPGDIADIISKGYMFAIFKRIEELKEPYLAGLAENGNS